MKPKIRIKEFDGDWQTRFVGEMFDPLKNNSLSRAELSEKGSVMNVHYGDILIKFGECIDTTTDKLPYIKDEVKANALYASCQIRKGDVIFADAAEDNTVGKCSEIISKEEDRIVSGLHTIACRPKSAFAERYLGYYLNSLAFHDQLLPHIQGTKISSLSRKAINNCELRYPDNPDEQKSIADFFTQIDTQISASKAKLVSLKQVKAACLQAMFPQEGEMVPRLRFKGFEKEWKKKAIGSIATFGKGKGYSKADLCEKGCPVILYGRLYTRYSSVITDVDTYVVPKEHSIYSKGGEVIIPGSGETPEDIAIASSVQKAGIIFGGDLNVLTFDPTKYESAFIALAITYGTTHKELSGYAQGKTIVHLHNSDIANGTIYLPCLCEQQQIASFLSSLDTQITLYSQRLEKLKQIKSACLDSMFV